MAVRSESGFRRRVMEPFRFHMSPGVSGAAGTVDRWIDKAVDTVNSFGQWKGPEPPPPERKNRESVEDKKNRWNDQSWQKLNE